MASIPLPPPRPDCWLWTGTVIPNGYGSSGGRSAHVVAYESVFGPVPKGLELHHVCEVRICVNPLHLVALTVSQHRRLHNASISACPQGHVYTKENTRLRNDRGVIARICVTCDRRRARETSARRYREDSAYRIARGGRP